MTQTAPGKLGTGPGGPAGPPYGPDGVRTVPTARERNPRHGKGVNGPLAYYCSGGRGFHVLSHEETSATRGPRYDGQRCGAPTVIREAALEYQTMSGRQNYTTSA